MNSKSFEKAQRIVDMLCYKTDKELFLILGSQHILTSSGKSKLLKTNSNQKIKLEIIDIALVNATTFELKFSFLLRTKESN